MGLWQKIQAFRQKNLERRAAVAKVRQKIKDSEIGISPEQTNKEALAISTKYGVTYKEALAYIESENSIRKTKESLRKLANSLHEVGVAAKESNAKRMEQDQKGFNHTKPKFVKTEQLF